MSETYPQPEPIDWHREDELDDDLDWTANPDDRGHSWSGSADVADVLDQHREVRGIDDEYRRANR